MPGGSFIFTWPLLFATLAMSRRPRSHDARSRDLAFVGLAPATVMLAPSFAASADGTLLFIAFRGLSSGPPVRPVHPVPRFSDQRTPMDRARRTGLLALVMIIKGNAASDFDASQPHPDSIFYFQDTDRERARWVSLDSRPDRFTAQFCQHHVLGGWLPKLVGLATRETPDSDLARISRDFSDLNRGRTTEGDAPLINAPPPELKVLDDSTIAGTRTVKMHIASARKASVVWMSVPVGVTVLGSSIDGRSPGDRVTDGWTGWYL